MGTTRTELYDDNCLELAEMAKVLGHPARINILTFLLKKGSCITGSIVEEVGLSQPTVSQHLKVLKDAGLIRGSVIPPTTCYCIDPEVWQLYRAALTKFLNAHVSGFNLVQS